MAILQLSRITNRKGLAQDLPQLAGAEFGWVLDERKLYIGNGTIADGAPVVDNTEILTQFSDILSLSSTYTYKGEAANYVVKTGENDAEIIRSLQSKFDEIASVKDFGAVGDGVTDDTAAINRALYELFCRELNPEIRRSLYFPAGKYKVSGTIKIPPHAKLWGEGLTSSIIEFAGADISVSAMIVNNRYAISDLGTTTQIDWESVTGTNPSAVDDIFIAGGLPPTITGTGRVRAVPSWVVETSDSLQQTGMNLGTNNAVTPTGIEMTTMAIYTTEENSLLKLDSVTNSGFSYLGLRGPRTDPEDVILIGYSTAAIELATSVGPTSDVTISKLDTQGSTYALKATGEVRGVVLENSGLSLHYKGVYVTNEAIAAGNVIIGERYKIISVGDSDFVAAGAEFNRIGVTFLASNIPTGSGTVILMSDAGPTGIVVTRNIFDNIAHEGVHFENVLFNSSGYNVFYNVGNALDIVGAVSPVISLDTDQCLSLGDLFEREDETSFPRIALGGNGGIFVDGAHSIHLGSYERQVGLTALMPVGTGSLINNLNDIANSYKIDYNIVNSVGTVNRTRMGTISISTSDATVVFDDQYTEAFGVNPVGVILDVVSIGNNDTSLRFTATEEATIKFSVVRLD